MDLQKRIEERIVKLELIMDNTKNISYLMDWNIADWKEKLGEALSIIKELQEQNRQLIQDLPRALGLLEGIAMFKDMEEFNKEGAIKIIKEVIGILKSKIGV